MLAISGVVFKKMKSSNFFIGIKEKPEQQTEDNDD
jgi:hypothetical protein